MADLVLVTKVDLAGGAVPAALDRRLAGLNPTARRVACDHGAVAPEALFDLGPWRQRHGAALIDDWLGSAALADHHHQESHRHGPHDHGHGHDPNRHGDDIRAFALCRPEPVAASALAAFLELLTASAGPDLLRVKGIVKLAEAPDKPLVLHAVQHVVHQPVLLDDWPSADQRTRLVFIVRGIDESSIATLFDALTRPASA